jgi:regulator of telomere elongation helicase 1
MSQILEGLEKNQNILIESPTGTGKTLCLLSSVLAWVNHKRK